ncbi:MAG TPA: hypothetical protein DDY78_16665 [Planctomycetales bacterium]|jgi:hypothetical protein|nr:hypothetical protein [Planctomycetales bacterium]
MRASLVSVFLAACFFGTSLAQAPKQEAAPLRFDWADFGVRGDKDYGAKLAAAKKKYDGKTVVVTGILAVQSSGGREIHFTLRGPTQMRGEAYFSYAVHAAMMDGPVKMLEQANQKCLIEVVGTMEAKQVFFDLKVEKITGVRQFKK